MQIWPGFYLKMFLKITSLITFCFCVIFISLANGQGDIQVVYAENLAEEALSIDEMQLLYYAPTETDEENRKALNTIISVDFEQVLMEEALQLITDQVGMRLSYSVDVPSKEWNRQVSLQLEEATVLGALYAVLHGTDLKLKITQKGLLLVHRGDPFKNEEDVVHGKEEDILQETVTGAVTDAQTGETLPGVNIVNENTMSGTTTDNEGKYSIEVFGPETVLIFSYIGYRTQRITVGDRQEIDVNLEVDVGRLDEVIVVGYGTVEKSDLTGSVQRVRAEDFQGQSMTQFTEMLAGTVTGLYATQGTGASGGSSSLEIRGPNSLTANTDPMIILDGVIYNGSLRDINPNDIETIDVLKDASSAAVFGARAASGVVMITTTKGSVGKPTINFSSKVGVTQAAKDRRPLNAEEFLEFRGAYFAEGALYAPTIPDHFYTNPNKLPDDISVEEWRNFNENPHSDTYTEYLQRLNLYPTEQKNALAGNTVDWYPLVMVKGLRQSYDLGISGGTENSRYYWSVGNIDNEGIIRGDQYSAVRSRLNIDFNITNWLSLGTNTQLTVRDESVVQANLGQMYIASPFGEEKNEDGTLRFRVHDDPASYHPLINYYGQDRERKINTFFSSIYTDVLLPFEIDYRLSFQPRYSYTNEQNFWGDQTITGSETYQNGYGTRQNAKIYEWTIDNLLKWNGEIGAHYFDITLLYSAEEFSSWSEFQSNQNFSPNPNLGFHGLQFGNNPSLSNNDETASGDAVMARINYTLLNKYLITASIRRDGYSAFGQQKSRATFPAVAFAWQIAEESFFNIDLVNQLKLRFSWGINGNRDIGRYSALARLASTLDYDGSNVQVGVENSTLANPSLAWEKTTAYNVGLDFGIFENRISASADYYVGTTNDLLMNRQLPRITGFTSITSNLGELENQGFEMTVHTVNISSSNFNWRSDFVFSLNRNKIVSLFGDTGEYTLLGESRSGELPDFSNEWFPGKAVDIVWNYDVIGVWQMEEAEEAAVYNMSPGDFKAVDVDEDGRYIDVRDKKFIGYTSPRYRLGFRNDFSYKNFSASIFIRADLGHLLPFNEALQGTLSHDRRNYNRGPMPYWTPENRNNEYARLRPIHSSYGGGLNIYKPASFARIQNLSLSYSLPTDIANRLQLNRMSIYLTAQNIFTLDHDIPWWDPESRMSPMPKTYTVGIDISL